MALYVQQTVADEQRRSLLIADMIVTCFVLLFQMTIFTLQDPDGNRMAIVGKTEDATGIEKGECEKPKST